MGQFIEAAGSCGAEIRQMIGIKRSIHITWMNYNIFAR